MSIVVATRFSEEVIEQLDEVARARKRTRAEIVREAVEMYLAEWADYAIALDRLNDPADPVLSEEEAWALLGLPVEDGLPEEDDETEGEASADAG